MTSNSFRGNQQNGIDVNDIKLLDTLHRLFEVQQRNY